MSDSALRSEELPLHRNHHRFDSELPVIVKMAFGSWIVVISVLVFASLYPSPWVTDSLPLFLNPPPFGSTLDSSRSITTPPVKGCQSVTTTRFEPREKAAIVLLLREQDLTELIPTLENFEHRFNKNFRYPYVFITSPQDPPFSVMFREKVAETLPHGAVTEWSIIEPEYWRIPSSMDEKKVREGFEKQEKDGVQYAGREGYHHMCRFYSGLWIKTEVLKKYDWYWRLEPGVENMNTIPSLFETVIDYIKRQGLKPGERIWNRFLTNGGAANETYSGCHFWSNFEIGDMRFFRSKAYQQVFETIDGAGGFYSERWGDAPVRSIALGLLADVDRIH